MDHAILLIQSVTALLVATLGMLAMLRKVIAAISGVSFELRKLLIGERRAWHSRQKPKNTSLKLR